MERRKTPQPSRASESKAMPALKPEELAHKLAAWKLVLIEVGGFILFALLFGKIVLAEVRSILGF